MDLKFKFMEFREIEISCHGLSWDFMKKTWTFTWFHHGPSLGAGGNEAPTFAFGPSASALRTAPYQQLELPEASAEASATPPRTAVILAFRDAGDEKRGGWPPDSIQHRRETSGMGWKVGESHGNRERTGDIFDRFFFNYKWYTKWISWENHLMGNQLADILYNQPARDDICVWQVVILGPGRWWKMIDRLWGRP